MDELEQAINHTSSATVMHDLFESALAAYETGEACVLCTVVRLDGSGYGRPGARLFLSESGERLGFISGGCLEKDLCRRVWEATEAGPKVIAFDTRGNSVEASRYNTGCEGVVFVFCQRVDHRAAGVIRSILDAYTDGQEVRLLTVYRSESQCAAIGDTILVNGPPTRSGLRQNSFVTSLPESITTAVTEKLLTATRNGSFALHDFNGDIIEAAIEIISPPRQVVIFGSGDDVIPVSAASVALGWRVTVVSHRSELTQAQRFPGAKVLCGPMHEVADELLQQQSRLGSNSDVLIMTHDFDRDVDLMEVLLDSPVRSIGLLGPKRRLARIVTLLYQRGRHLSEQDIARIRSPLGLDIGANSPTEIATAIVAELIALSRDRPGGFLHERGQPIHQPSEHELIGHAHAVATQPESVTCER